ncbi:MAG: DUF1566 domain-containing protein [Deltaproteobacteria bacterium]|nr:DUF1566 domain-containing protein [Deltaproteobacteria bacterium]
MKKVFFSFLVLLSTTPFSFAGNLDPSGPPAPTMKTLNQIPPTWDQKLPASQRFKVVLEGEGVLDLETGLVWQRKPTPHSTGDTSFSNAQKMCYAASSGGRSGWRLPAIWELRSLIDPMAPSASGSALSEGHPFQNVGSCYWSDTPGPKTTDGQETSFWGYISNSTPPAPQVLNSLCGVWCVRGSGR